MTMYSHTPKAKKKNLITLYARVAIDGSSVATVDSDADFAVTKTAAKTGRYTCTVSDKALKFVSLDVTYVDVDDAAIAATALPWVIRDIDIGTGANDGTVEVQFVSGTTDTNIVSRTIIIEMVVQK